MKRIRIRFIVVLLNVTGCLFSTLYYEIGSEICLNFTKYPSRMAIKRNDVPICTSLDPVNTTFSFDNWNKTFNCTLSGTTMPVCFKDFQLEDVGLFSSHPSVVNGSTYLQNITLQRAVSVATVNLTPASILSIAGQTMKLTCTTSYCNPPANIMWYLSSKDITNQSKPTVQTDMDLVSTISLLQRRVDKRDNKKQVYCTARNSPGRTVKSMLRIVSVLYVPEVTLMIKSPHPVTEGRTVVLECNVTDANPNTNITWKWFRSSSNTSFPHNGPIYTISDITRNKAGLYNCMAINSAGTSLPTSTYVNVQYKPEVSAMTKSPYRVIEGQEAALECKVLDANPNASITWKWTKVSSNTNAFNDGPIFKISNVMRNSTGSYNCSAKNSIGISVGATITIDVQYKPEVTIITPSPLKVQEGFESTMECKLHAANPKTNITWIWFKTDTPGYVLNYGPIYIISNIQRNRTGIYSCTANNSVGTSVADTIYVDVLYKPEIVENNHGTTEVNENEQVTLYRQIVSNPLSNVSWYNGSDLLKNQWSVRNATFNIEKATCTDAKNYTLLANNGVKENVTALVELIVNCKPRSYKTNVTLGVTDTTGIDFSTIVIAYPEPSIELEHENGTVSDQMMKIINRNAVNNFTIQISQAVVNQSDFGVYHLKLRNSYGKFNVIINVIPQRKPNVPVSIEIVCEETRAKVQWKSSFNGGDPQLFTVIASSGQQSNNISDRGENVFHSTFVQHLQPSTMYVFYVSAQNSHGIISSEKKSCTTLAESTDKLPIIAGSAAAGGLTLVVILVVVFFLFRRYTNTEKQAGKSQRFENDLVENESGDDDGLKDNILYVSADPKENEKHEAAVYAAVNKKNSMSNNNSNVYAEVKKNGKNGVKEGALYSDVKPKKGFFKKDGKVKKEKRQKRKQEVADVYENSDDIAMTANPDTVYSNTNQNNDSAKEERGYKNKDGLLYIEVKFDTKTEERNPVIHGDDEKTDYATVEFPVPSSSHDRE